MSNSNNFDPEIFLKGKLEEQLNVSIRHNTKGNDWTKTIDNLEAGVIIGKSKIGKATLR